ncbi:MAG: competence/damage-inducible protein A [Firmicutes bacterium]|nr:competence/damage-inducible protein A [Bacillota bacterium]
MIAEIVGVGTELLLGQIVNSNAQYLSDRLASLGVNVYYHVVVGDNAERLAGVIRQALARSDLVITTGGLGPTMDDLTRETVASVLGRRLVFDADVWEEIEAFFERVRRRPTDNNRRQAYVIEGAGVLPNSRGTAPGLVVEEGGKVVALLPGPPQEMTRMFEDHVVPYLIGRGAGAEIIHSRVLKVCSLGESAVEDKLRDLMEAGTNPTVAPYAYPGEVRLRVTARARSKDEAEALIHPVEAEIRSRLGEFVFGADECTLEAAVGERLRCLGLTLSLAESCTGGLVGHRVTDVAGSSDYFLGGFVAYSNDLKVGELGVKEETLRRFGAVSEQVALEMADGARSATGSGIGIGITGIAGPSGGSEAKPVGTVHIAIAGPNGSYHRGLSLWGDRRDIKWRASQEALAMLWRYLSKAGARV